MIYLGFDGIGYRTGLASSDDLVNWRKQGMIIDRGPVGSPTQHGIGMNSILRDNQLFGPGTPKKVAGKYVGTYHAYPQPGYESGPGVIGLCFSEDLRRWEPRGPILAPDPHNEWESSGLYKSWLMEDKGMFHLFYNAKNSPNWPWCEQIGLALSRDLVNWTRHPLNPILRVGPKGEFDDMFAADPCVLKHEDTWVMFYFGNCSDGAAREGAAFSEDLLSWRKSKEILIDVGPAGSVDSLYAHKPGIIAGNGRLFHFYCAVSPAASHQGNAMAGSQTRGITFACGGNLAENPANPADGPLTNRC